MVESSRMRPRLSIVAVCLVLAACGRGGGEAPAAGGRPGGPGGGPGGPGGPDGQRVVAVEVAPAELGTASRSVTVSGTVEPLRRVGVNSQMAGALTFVGVEEGSVVRQGSVVARLEAAELQAQLESARASLRLAQETAARSAQLREAQVVTAAESDRDQAALASARATVSQLQTRIGYATVRSPISGVITEKRVERGDVVAPNARLFTVSETSTLVVRVSVSELDVTGLRAGQNARVELDALPGMAASGRIRRVFPAADTVARQVPVEVELTGPAARRALPGFLARVSFDLGARDNVLLIPQGAVVGGNNTAVFVVSEGTAQRRPVRIGVTTQGRVEIREGLAPGEPVVVVGADMLRDGSPVRVVQPVGDGPGAGQLGARPPVQGGTP